MNRLGHIVAMGGGGFLMEPDNPLLDDFILSLAQRPQPRVCFLPTASGDSPYPLISFYRALCQKARTTDLVLFDRLVTRRSPPLTSDIASFLAEQDVIYVGGGNTANALALWRVHGVDKALAEAWKRGAVLCGVSAGMICWFEAGCTDSFGGTAALHDGLGFLSGSSCPHYDNEANRRPTYQQLIREGFPAGYAADDGAALHFEGTTLVGAVSSRPQAMAYRVEMHGNTLEESAIPTRFLGR